MEAVAEATGLPVTVMSRLNKVSAPNNLLNTLPLYISCLGCAAAPVDFIPEQYSKTKKKESQKKKTSISVGVTILLVGILGGGALSVFAYDNHSTALEEKLAIEKKVADIAYADAVYNNSIIYEKCKNDLVVMENMIKSPNDELRQFIDELEKKMPAEINVLSARCTKEGIGMNVTVTTKPAAAKTIQQLRTFETIGDIVVGQIIETVDEIGNKTVSFTVECSYVYETVEMQPAGGKPASAPADDDAPADGSVAQG